MKHSHILLSVLFMVVLLSGCTQQPPPQDYVILSTQDYNRSLCGGTGFGQQEAGFNSGIKILTKDSETGDNVASNSYMISQFSEGSLFPGSFSCLEQLSDPEAAISVYSKGHSPMIFSLPLLENKLAEIEVFLKKSCTGGPDCFGSNTLAFLKQSGGNQTQTDESMNNLRSWFYNTASEKFLLNQSDYTPTCMECNYGRGGFLKMQGTYNNTPFTLYYHTGWCSPGGGDCGWSACFSETSAAPSAKYIAIKNKLCNEIDYFNLTEYHPTPDTYSYNRTNDLTNETRAECLQGAFEKTEANTRTISIIQDSSMMGAFVRKGETDCLAL